ncbi:MAG: zinc-dependent alcohol dehydrogenase family protein [Mariprofundaceae bacterium]|nr:zinc-dependent alcohol dehydrogenase family protein [Mariprofundaceae bacterium]
MTSTGGPEVLQEQQLPIPPISEPDEIRVRLRACGLNPVDTKLRANDLYFPDGMPAILGCDGAGIVEACGEAVSDFAPGDEVFFCYGGLGQQAGNYAEYTVIPACAAARKAARTDFSEAAAAPLVLITAWEALFDRAGMQAGQQVFIHAGAGGVGHVAIQLAKIAGCSVATTVSDDAKAEFVAALGADCIINYRQHDVADALLDWTNGRGVDIAFDTVGGDAFTQLIPAVRIYGDLVSILQVPTDTDFQTLRLRNIRISQELMLTPMVFKLRDGLAHHAEILTRCAEYMQQDRLHVHVARTLPLAQAGEAHRLIEAGGMSGKLVLDI